MTSLPARLWPAAQRVVVAFMLAASLSACATSAANPKDPFEKFNRAMFSFNDAVDQHALKPVATAYKTVLPSFVQTGVGNFFGNLADVWSAVNNLLQGKGQAGMSDVTRFALNSTFGLVGLLDVATPAGLQKHNEDFGQTLGTWGVPSGPYLMLPLLGNSTLRDTLALPLDIKADPWQYTKPIRARNVGTVVRVVDQRAAVLDASNLMEEAALDRYEFIRDSYLQRRESLINSGGGKRKFGKDGDGYDDKPLYAPPTDAAAAPPTDAAAAPPAADPVPATVPAAAAPAPATSTDGAALSSEAPARELTPAAGSANASGSQP